MKVKVIASGSTGNCTYVETKDHKILIDTGISKKGIEVALNSIEVEFKEIDTVLITHEHDDHIRSLSAVLKKSEIQKHQYEGDAITVENDRMKVSVSRKSGLIEKLVIDGKERAFEENFS